MLRIMLLLTLLQGALMAIEEPKYTLIQKNRYYVANAQDLSRKIS